jgi:hypothetical protein
MAISVKISQLISRDVVDSADQIPVARGTETYRIPANQFVIGGQNIGSGPGQIYFDSVTDNGRSLRFRSLSGVDGVVIGTSGDTLVVSASGQNPVKTSLTGNGTTTTFAINGANSINANNYRVDIDGVLQEPLSDYTINGSNIVFNPAPPNGSKVTVVSNNLVRAYDIVPSDGSVTTAKLITEIQNALLPTGAVMSFYRTTAPSGWLVCDGTAIPAQFTALIALVGPNTPNLQGQFIRGLTTNTSTASRDPLSASRVNQIGSVQGDAIRNITGTLSGVSGATSLAYNWGFKPGTTGAIDVPYSQAPYNVYAGAYNPSGGVGFAANLDASLVVPTAPENRPVNIALLYCIKT